MPSEYSYFGSTTMVRLPCLCGFLKEQTHPNTVPGTVCLSESVRLNHTVVVREVPETFCCV